MTVNKFFGGLLFFVALATTSYTSHQLVERSPMAHSFEDFMRSTTVTSMGFGIRTLQLYLMIRTLLQSRPYFTSEPFSGPQEVIAFLNATVSALSFFDLRLLESSFAPYKLHGECCESLQCCNFFQVYYPRAEHLFYMFYFGMTFIHTARYAYNVIYRPEILPNTELCRDIECSVCYDLNDEQSFITPCPAGHSLCQGCYGGILNAQPGIKKPPCPLCRKQMVVKRTSTYPANLHDRAWYASASEWNALKLCFLTQLVAAFFFVIQTHRFLYADWTSSCY